MRRIRVCLAAVVLLSLLGAGGLGWRTFMDASKLADEMVHRVHPMFDASRSSGALRLASAVAIASRDPSISSVSWPICR